MTVLGFLREVKSFGTQSESCYQEYGVEEVSEEMDVNQEETNSALDEGKGTQNCHIDNHSIGSFQVDFLEGLGLIMLVLMLFNAIALTIVTVGTMF